MSKFCVAYGIRIFFPLSHVKFFRVSLPGCDSLPWFFILKCHLLPCFWDVISFCFIYVMRSFQFPSHHWFSFFICQGVKLPTYLCISNDVTELLRAVFVLFVCWFFFCVVVCLFFSSSTNWKSWFLAPYTIQCIILIPLSFGVFFPQGILRSAHYLMFSYCCCLNSNCTNHCCLSSFPRSKI